VGTGNLARHAKVRARWLAGMWNLAAFVQSVKQRFSVWFNKVQEEEQARLPSMKMLGIRVRYFTDGLVIGTRELVNGESEQQRDYFSEKRQSGSRRMKGDEWGALRSMRALQKKVRL
jgi:hypothetical protein